MKVSKALQCNVEVVVHIHMLNVCPIDGAAAENRDKNALDGYDPPIGRMKTRISFRFPLNFE